MSEKNYKELYNELLVKYNDEVEELKKSIVEEKNAITSLQRTIGGYITQAAKNKKEIATLKSDLEAKCLSLQKLEQELLEIRAKMKECMNEKEKSIKEVTEAYKQELEKCDAVISKLRNENEEQVKRCEEEKRTTEFYKQNYENYKNAPWYKRIFMN